MPQSIAFHGAAQTVTGSRHLLTLNGKKILVDCGLFQGPREIRDRNWEPLDFDPRELDGIIITHAHTDHIGFLPKLAAMGYRGPIWATPASIDLCKVSLPDSAKIQEEDARYHNKHGIGRHQPALPLYTIEDANKILGMMIPVNYYQFTDLPGNGTFQFKPAGHILGSAWAEIYFEDGQRIVMSGDIGRWDRPLLIDPDIPDFGEYVVCESTYGDRLHAEEDPIAQIEEIFRKAIAMKSVVLVPSFAIGRTQELLWIINELVLAGRLPKIPIYVDSPMANAATLLYARHTEELDKETRIDMREGHSPFAPDMVTLVRDMAMSKQLNNAKGPIVIIAGSGMASGGRILHHMKHHIGNQSTMLLFTGYQAEGTIGREILEGAPFVKIHGDEIPMAAQSAQLTALSAHGDQSELLRWLKGLKQPPKKMFIVHGDPEVQIVFQKKVQEELGWDVVIPAQGESFDLS